MNDNWESEIGGLLGELADVQTALLGTLSEKRLHVWRRAITAALSAMAGREQELAESVASMPRTPSATAGASQRRRPAE